MRRSRIPLGLCPKPHLKFWDCKGAAPLCRPFTLLEIMVGLALILMAAGAIGWKMQGFLETRRFRVSLEQFRSRLLTAQCMAVNMQADWEGVLRRDGKNWTFETVCLDPPSVKGRALKLHFSKVFFEGKEESGIAFTFFSSGEVRPSGRVQMRDAKGGKTENWDLLEVFGKSAGSGRGKNPGSKNLAPAHPSD
jgi:hypothetical protein